MLARRINGALPISRLRSETDRLFGDFFEGLPGLTFSSAVVFPALNVWEDPEHVFVEAELPGLKLDDIELFVMGDVLTIKGERKDVAVEKASYHRRERGTGCFNRTLELPVSIKSDDVAATLRDGILLITLPKAEEAKPRKVEVKTV